MVKVATSTETEDYEFLLSCPYSGLQIVEGIAPTHRHPALTHDGAGVVVSIYQMNRNTRVRLAGLQHCFEHPITRRQYQTPNCGFRL